MWGKVRLMDERLRAVGLLWCLFVLLMMLTFGVYCLVLTAAKAKVIPHASPSLAHRTASPTVGASPTAIPLIRSPLDGISNPVRLIIPAIGIDAAIESLGILSNGDLATPVQHPWDDAGWYSLGPRPGEEGSAVIDGHLDRPGGYPAVFWELRDLHIGDRVTVVDARGKSLTFHVTHIEFYPVDAMPIQEIFGNNQGFYLNLITCAGDWIPDQHQTNQRLVVYTVLN